MFFHIEVVLTHFDLISCRKHSLCGGGGGGVSGNCAVHVVRQPEATVIWLFVESLLTLFKVM